jgi:(p)ppGpp synthase/HD superfamily hydrolase
MTIEPRAVMGERYAEAVAYAAKAHRDQVRKGSDVTYLCHLLGVSSLVLEAGGDEDEAIAGLLHDAVEDSGGMARADDIRERFGDRVAQIVLACSDSTDADWKARVDYWERKQAYLDRMATTDDLRALMVSIADKVHNARATATQIAMRGPEALGDFRGTPLQVARYYEQMLRIARERDVSDVLVIPLAQATAAITAAAERIERQR